MACDEIVVKEEDSGSACIAQDFDDFMTEMENDTSFFSRKRKLSNSVECADILGKDDVKFTEIALKSESQDPSSVSQDPQPGSGHPDHVSLPSMSESPRTSPFESLEQSETSVSTEAQDEKVPVKTENPAAGWGQPNIETVATLKRSMAGNSRLIGTFTALKTTYIKLCKEFNFLLGKFNENERIKIELIHENNELRKLLYETIKEKELDRKRYKAELSCKRARVA